MSEITHEIEGLLPGIAQVHVVNAGEIKGDSKRCFYRSTHRTIVLSSSQQALELVSGPDPTRTEVVVIAIDAPAVIGDQSTVASADNTVTSIPTPRGTIIPTGQPVAFTSQSELWAACPLTGNNVNRIGVITTHEVPI